MLPRQMPNRGRCVAALAFAAGVSGVAAPVADALCSAVPVGIGVGEAVGASTLTGVLGAF
jgi:hypothetical protein